MGKEKCKEKTEKRKGEGKEAGLDTCAQEAWSMKQESVSDFFQVDDETMLFCGMAIGYKDPNALINQLKSERRPLEEWATFIK